MSSEKTKRKNQPTIPQWKRGLHYLLPWFLLSSTGFLVLPFIYTISDEFKVILPLLVIPNVIKTISILGMIILAIIAMRRMRLHILAYIVNGMIILTITFFWLLLSFGRDSRIVHSLYLPEKSFQLVHVDSPNLFRFHEKRGNTILYSCDRGSIFCTEIHSWYWGQGWKPITIAQEEPISELQQLDDVILVYANGNSIYKLDIETELAINR